MSRKVVAVKALKTEAKKWSPWWVAMWALIAVVLLPAAFFLNFFQFATLVILAFGVPEFIGTLKQNDAFPPLTHVIVRYVDREIAFLLIFGVGGAIGAYWFGFPHPERMGAFAALMGWFNAHFDRRYEQGERT